MSVLLYFISIAGIVLSDFWQRSLRWHMLSVIQAAVINPFQVTLQYNIHVVCCRPQQTDTANQWIFYETDETLGSRYDGLRHLR